MLKNYVREDKNVSFQHRICIRVFYMLKQRERRSEERRKIEIFKGQNNKNVRK